MLFYSDDGIDKRLAGKVRGLSGVMGEETKSVLVLSSESSSQIRKGHVVGKISTVLELPDDNDGDGVGAEEGNTNDPLSQVNLTELNPHEQAKVFDMLQRVRSVFSTGEFDIGHANVTEHVIRLSDDTPIYQRPRRFPPPVASEIERQCEELQALDIIEPSMSPWNSPIVPIIKKGNGLRLCLDYRKLNKITIPDRHPVPNLADSIFGLHGTKYFTRLDLVKSYYQIPIDQNSRPYTAFATPKNHWQFKRLSFGLRNAPSAFQREIQAVLSSFPSNKVIAYIDDILIMGTNFNEHLSLVEKVLLTLENYRLKIKPSKCEFFKSEVEFLGHIINRSGIRKTPEYVQKVSDYPRPNTKGELREFLGLVNFQRKFLPNCSVIQKPLSCHTSGHKKKVLEWTEEMVEAFESLKAEMKNEVELAYPDYSEGASPIELWVDASDHGAGAYLAQDQGGSHRVIGFASMSFDGPKLNYSTLERELCALRWGIKTFKPFLYGVKFNLFTDHQPLVHLHNMKIVCSRLARTVEELADFNFDIYYVAGNLNTAADALSRICSVPLNVGDKCDSSLPDGLIVDGPCIPGGGDSMVLSLHQALSRLVHRRPLPNTAQTLRELLVDEVLQNPSRYKINLDRGGRKKLRLMRHQGQLPSFDLLMAASYLFEVAINVYFWPQSPMIFQFKDFQNGKNMFLQCISGIHFNPLCTLSSYQPPDSVNCSVSLVQSSVCQCYPKSVDESPGELDLVGDLDAIVKTVQNCNHADCSLPRIFPKFGDICLCAIFDCGAEISIVTESALGAISKTGPIRVNDEFVGSAVGFSGSPIVIQKTVELSFNIGACSTIKPFKFAVVGDKYIPCCLLLGLDFMSHMKIDLDFSKNVVSVNNEFSCVFSVNGTFLIQPNSVLVITNEIPSLNLRINTKSNEFRFEIEGSSHTIRGLSLINDDRSVRLIQRNCSQLRKLRHCLYKDIDPRNWPRELKQFKTHCNNLTIRDNLLLYGKDREVLVVPHKFLTGIALVLHNEYAHVGRDKLRDLLRDIFWHPSCYTICNDICVSCTKCQIMKEYSSVVTPPTIRIQSSYPFEILAVDLISFPKTSQGYIGCLVAVDHFSKWVAAVPLRDKKGSTVAKALQYQLLPFLPRVPTNVLSDNGPEFVSSDFNESLDFFSIKHKLITPGQPSSNGAVERCNRSIKNLIRSVTESGCSWNKTLPHVVITYNNTTHSELGMSPSDFLLQKAHSSERVTVLSSEVREMWREGHPSFCPFKVGQLVLSKVKLKGFLNTNKFSANFNGPLEVINVDSNGVTYQLKHCKTGLISRAHHSKLRAYRPPPQYIKNHPYFSKYYQDVGEPDCVANVGNVQIPHIPVTRDVSDTESECSDCSYSSDPSFDGDHGKEFGISDCSPGNSAAPSCCPGCTYENRREDIMSQSCPTFSSVLADIGVDETSPSGFISKTRNLLDWSDSDSSEFDLPSVDSQNMIDDSKDDDCIAELSPRGDFSELVLFQDDSADSSINDFTGFESSCLPDDRLSKLRNLIEVNESVGEVGGHQLRSRGPVRDLPNVQGRVLERRPRNRN